MEGRASANQNKAPPFRLHGYVGPKYLILEIIYIDSTTSKLTTFSILNRI
jgi:hypothetical protein